MSTATSNLRRALFRALGADPDLTTAIGSERIFDRVPERVRPPYIVLGRSTVSDWSTATDEGEAIVFFIHVWSLSDARQECEDIQDHVRRVLASAPTLEQGNLVALRFQLAETRRDRPSGYVHGVLRFRAVIET